MNDVIDLPAPQTRVVGTYALEDGNAEHRNVLIRETLATGLCTGLEIPALSAGYKDMDWLWPLLPDGSRHVFTMVTATMEAIARDPLFGLASADGNGRGAAMNMMRAAADIVRTINDVGRIHIDAVEIQSAPSQSDQSAAAQAFEQSLAELVSWNWAGATIAVEHCDSRVGNTVPAKGFLGLTDEIDIVRRLRSDSSTPLGVTINWGRSAIELRDPDGVTEHIRQTVETDTLAGIMYSGTCAKASDFGPAWTDSHAPLHFMTDASEGESASELTEQRMTETRKIAEPALYDGVKMSIRPLDRSIDDKVKLIRRALQTLQQGI
ncbi:UDP-N-acetylglucosamine pyrophosphorylase [Bifidobacterium margollesii]|uniref:UDP-N-acetylglucosamine pyrophosphorylase n=1 Tax=Bifidobacterium margollesii TaxID=2020964 RepID=A0A2N5JB80_9BIFI|nr:DUF4862 family protein [Bifidobacterium margollesii]PLS31462.1 UDP-N-acetylglucosamine pyrophosphorylase [Bifidobacterium margollesii]